MIAEGRAKALGMAPESASSAVTTTAPDRAPAGRNFLLRTDYLAEGDKSGINPGRTLGNLLRPRTS